MPVFDCPPPLEFVVGGGICVTSPSHREWWGRKMGEAAAAGLSPLGVGDGEVLFASLFLVLGSDVDGNVPFLSAPEVCVRLALAGWTVEATDTHNVSASREVKGGTRFLILHEKIRVGGSSFWRWNVTGKF